MPDRTILIIGASSGIGRRAVDMALERGCMVRAMARSAESIEVESERVERFAGDATERDDMHQALEGVDAVILALGIGPGAARRLQPVTLFSEATKLLVEAMEAQGPRRLVAVTGYGAGESRAAMNRLEGFGHRLLLGRAYADKDRQEAIIMESDLNWTIARPTILTKGPATGEYQVLSDPDSWRNGLVSRADVAQFLVDRALDGGERHKAPVLVY